MKRYSPNLKPEQLHNHADAAEHLGVPRGNILDLRSTEPAETVAEAVAQVEPLDTILASADDSAVISTPEKKTWWQRRCERLSQKRQSKLQADFIAATAIEAQELATPEPAALTELVTTDPAAVPAEPPVEPVSLASVPVEPVPQAAPVPEAAQLFHERELQPRVKHRWQWQWRPVAAFMAVGLCSIAPITVLALLHQVSSARTQVETISREAAAQLHQGADYSTAFNFPQAAQSFDQAATDFRSAHDQLTSVNAVLTPILQALPKQGNQFTSAENILVAGEQLAAAGADMATAFTVLDQGDAQSTTELLVAAHSAFRPAVPRLERASLALNEIDLTTVPVEYRDQIAQAQQTVPVIRQSMKGLLSLSETLLIVLGHDSSKRYLVLFQNNHELRATGGFIGSFAVVDIYQGKVNSIEIPGGGPYDLAGNLNVKVAAPQPLHLVNAHWQMQDANWWPDFPTSAQKIQWFYRKSGGSTVDGVITLTPDIIEQMLALTGPIALPEYGVTIDDQNFYDITQTQAERKYDDTRASKKFIADLTPKLLNQLFALDAKNFLPVLQILYSGLTEKNILLYFNDPFLENELADRGWTGEIKQTSRDYLQVVNTNIGGGKTDAAITETIQHNAAIQTDGTVTDTVTITRTHQGQTDDTFAAVNNVDYVRVYVPAASELVSAEGFTQPDPNLFLEVGSADWVDEDLQNISGDILIDEQTQTRINQEFGKTVFANWLITKPGETSRAIITYRLPFRVQPAGLFQPSDYYSLLVQKQPGSFDPLLITQLTYPSTDRVVWSYPDATGQLNQTLRRDVFMGMVLERS